MIRASLCLSTAVAVCLCGWILAASGEPIPTVEVDGIADTTASTQSPRPAVGLNPAVLLFHKPHHTNGVPLVRKAGDLGCNRVNVVATMLCQLDEEGRVLRYGMLHKGRFIALDESRLADFRYALQETFREADAQGMNVSVVAHLNSWGENSRWRNYFAFDPLEKLEGYSYREAVIGTILESLLEAGIASEGTTLSLTGEMGRSVFLHADQYSAIIEQLRTDLRFQKLSLGVSLNFNRVAGDVETTEEHRQAVQELINRCDFLGMSCYRWFDLPPKPCGFVAAIDHFLRSLKENEVVVPASLPLQFTEVGLGGGNMKGKPAKTPEIAAKSPWAGSDLSRHNPWETAEMIELRFAYYQALLDFLRTQPASHYVQAAYMWSEGSWDPFDLHGGGFGDVRITDTIVQHNQCVAQACFAEPGE